jgi:hypothetical protein
MGVYIRTLKTKAECTKEYCDLLERYAEIRKAKEAKDKQEYEQPRRPRKRRR